MLFTETIILEVKSMLKNPILFSLLMIFAVFSSLAVAEDILDDLSPSQSSGAPEEPGGSVPVKDLPVVQAEDIAFEYRIGPLDLIAVEVFLSDELGREARVNTAGYISLPLIGGVKVAGLTVGEAERKIEKVLGEKYMRDPHVTVFIKEFESQKFTVEGWVNGPGVYPLKGKTTFLQAIASARGMHKMADLGEVALFRTLDGVTKGYVLSYKKVRAGQQANLVLQKDDIIVVNRSGSKAAWALVTTGLSSFIGWSVLF